MCAGVLLVEHHVERHPISKSIVRSGCCIIMFRDCRNGRYADAGGARSGEETTEECATRELREESVGLFSLDVGSMNKSRVHLQSGYTVFIVPVRHSSGICDSYYKYNSDSLASICGEIPTCVRETNDMRRFFIDDIIDMVTRKTPSPTMCVPDSKCNLCIISKRTVCVLQKAFSRGFLTQRFKWNRLLCVDGTMCSARVKSYTNTNIRDSGFSDLTLQNYPTQNSGHRTDHSGIPALAGDNDLPHDLPRDLPRDLSCQWTQRTHTIQA